MWRSQISDFEIFHALQRERTKALNGFTRSLALAVVGSIWLQANRPTLSVTISLIDLTIPASFVSFFVATLLLGAGISLVSYFVLNEFARVATTYLFKFDSAWTLSLLNDSSNAWALSWAQQFRFLSSSRPHKILGTASALILLVPVVLTGSLVYWTVFSIGIGTVQREGWTSLGSFLSLISFMIVLFPPINAYLIFVPFTFTKNAQYIRWLFLARMHRKHFNGQWPLRVDEWIKGRP